VAQDGLQLTIFLASTSLVPGLQLCITQHLIFEDLRQIRLEELLEHREFNLFISSIRKLAQRGGND
jgi:hypothetical protein